jgi:ribonucleoside-diphosphate reductase alpha chain
MTTAIKLVKPAEAPQAVLVQLQEASQDIWDRKYNLKDKNEVSVDGDINGTFVRVANDLAECEEPGIREFWQGNFLWALNNGAIPAGRIMSNAGALLYKPATSLINCTVSTTIDDSMRSILEHNVDAGITLKAGCGIGYNFSTLRPSGAFVSGAGAYTSGPISFMHIFDKMCFTVSSAGGRRGAQMGTMDIGHPDVVAFIKAKREDGVLRQFNLSILITAEFIAAVKAQTDWKLAFPATQAEIDDGCELVYRKWPTTGEGRYTRNSQGLTAMRVYKTIPAINLWNLIMSSTYDYAEPGFLLIDQVNDFNNNWWCENIVATNP